MKTFEINITVETNLDGTVSAVNTHFIKTDATSEQVQEAINFAKRSADKNVEKLLQALRILGFKASEVKIEPVDVFEF